MMRVGWNHNDWNWFLYILMFYVLVIYIMKLIFWIFEFLKVFKNAYLYPYLFVLNFRILKPIFMWKIYFFVLI